MYAFVLFLGNYTSDWHLHNCSTSVKPRRNMLSECLMLPGHWSW